MKNRDQRDWERIRRIPVAADWKVIPGYLCRSCGDPARRHPETAWIWGCLRCGTTTLSVSIFFRMDYGSGGITEVQGEVER